MRSHVRFFARFATLAIISAFSGISSLDAQDGIIFDDAPESYSIGADTPGLCSIEFRFLSGDQHLRSMKGIPNLFGSRYLFDLSDNDYDQGVYGLFRWWDLRWRGSLRFATVSNCRDGCWLRIPPVSSSQELVLAGLDFRFTGEDHHIRDIEIWPYPESGWIWVKFRDNSTSNAFNATIAYVLMPRSDHYRFASYSRGDEWSEIDRPKAAGTSYLQGIKARFRNGDHHLERFWVDVCGDRVRGSLHDAGGINDPYRLDLKYVTYQPYH